MDNEPNVDEVSQYNIQRWNALVKVHALRGSRARCLIWMLSLPRHVGSFYGDSPALVGVLGYLSTKIQPDNKVDK